MSVVEEDKKINVRKIAKLCELCEGHDLFNVCCLIYQTNNRLTSRNVRGDMKTGREKRAGSRRGKFSRFEDGRPEMVAGDAGKTRVRWVA